MQVLVHKIRGAVVCRYCSKVVVVLISRLLKRSNVCRNMFWWTFWKISVSIRGNLIRSRIHPYILLLKIISVLMQLLQFWLNNFNFQFLLEPISSEAVLQTTIPV